MDHQRFDHLTRRLATAASRRTALRRLAAVVLGGAVVVGEAGGVSASHKTRHCTKLGKRCHHWKECCGGVCGPEGICLSCAGVVAWAEGSLGRLAELDGLLGSVRDDLALMAEEAAFDGEVVRQIGVAAGAIGGLAVEARTEVTPPAAANPLRTLLETLAAAAEVLAAYLKQVYEEDFIETGERVAEALSAIAIGIPSLEAEIAVLRDDCDD